MSNRNSQLYQRPLFLLANFTLTSAAISLRSFLRSAQVDNGILQGLLVINPYLPFGFQRTLKFRELAGRLTQVLLNTAQFIFEGLVLEL